MGKRKNHSIELRDHHIFYFLKRCEHESKKANLNDAENKKSENTKSDANPNYCLSEEAFKKIKSYYKSETFELSRYFQVNQEQMNVLYEDLYFSTMDDIRDNKGEATAIIIVAGQKHNDGPSFVQDIMVYEIAKKMFGFQHLFVELDPETLADYASVVTHNKELLYNNVNSFCYLSNLAVAQGISVTPVDEKEARKYLLENLDKVDNDLLTGRRDFFMARNIKEKFPDSSTGVSLVLCGAAHIPTLTYFLKKEGNYHIVVFDVREHKFGFKLSNGIFLEYDVVFKKDNQELHARILTAQTVLTVKLEYGSGSPKPKDNKENDEVEVIDPVEIAQEVKNSGTCMSSSSFFSTTTDYTPSLKI